MWGTSDESVSEISLSMRAALKDSGAAPRNLMLSVMIRVGRETGGCATGIHSSGRGAGVKSGPSHGRAEWLCLTQTGLRHD
jgi:hypothetical protein